MREHKGLGWGIFLLFFGVVLLLVNLDVIDWSVFRSFRVLWPLLLVVAGISVLARNKRWVVALAWVGFLVLLVVYGFYYSQPEYSPPRWEGGDRVLEAQAESGLESAVLRLELDAGDISIAGGGSKLAVVDTNDRRLSLKTRGAGGKQTVEIGSRNLNWFPFPGLGGLRSDIALSSDIPWEIDVQTDAANTRIDMEDLAVTDLDVDGDACNLYIRLSDRAKSQSISVDADVSHITIVVPENVGVRYTIRGDIQHVSHDNVPFVPDGEGKQTEGYADAAAQVEIDLDMDVGSVTFKR